MSQEVQESDFVQTKVQTASQDYTCDSCGEVIPDETKYVRVAYLRPFSTRRGGSAEFYNGIEHHHPRCWDAVK